MQIYDHGNVLWLEESLRATKQNSGWPKKWAKFEGCLWILILNFQFMLIKLKWVWLDMVYSQSMIKKKKKMIKLCAWGGMIEFWVLEFWCEIDQVMCSLKEPLVFVKSSTWMWPLPDCGSLRCVCNYKKCYHNSVSITWKHLKYVFNFHNSSLKN